MRHILFHIPTPWGGIPIMGYGLMIVLGFLCGISLACWRARRVGENPEHVVNLGLLGLLGGVIGGRLVYVLEHLDDFTRSGFLGNLRAIIDVRAGGLVYYGGLLLSIGLAILYIRRKKISGRRILDIVAPSLMLGLAFGRAGCTLNGCCWGGHCTLESPAAQRSLGITFPFGSGAFEQQAGDLPWKIVDSDGTVYGWAEPVQMHGVTSHLLRKYDREQSSVPAPYVTIPVQMIEPADLVRDERLWTTSWRSIGSDRIEGVYVREQQDGVEVWDWQRDLQQVQPPKVSIDVPARLIHQNPETEEPYLIVAHVARDGLPSEQKKLAGVYRSLPVYPVQIIGIIDGLLLCLILSAAFVRRTREGQVFALMLLLYPITRFIEEAIRKDTEPWFDGLTTSQNISLALFVVGVVVWLAIRRLPAVVNMPLTEPTAEQIAQARASKAEARKT